MTTNDHPRLRNHRFTTVKPWFQRKSMIILISKFIRWSKLSGSLELMTWSVWQSLSVIGILKINFKGQKHHLKPVILNGAWGGDLWTLCGAVSRCLARFSCSLAHMKLEHCSLPQEKDRVDSIGGTKQTSSLKIKKCSKSTRKPAPKLPFESTFLFSIGQKIGQKLKKKKL